MTSVNALQSSAQERLRHGPYASSLDAVAADQRRRMLEALPHAVEEHGFEATTVEHIVKLGRVRRNSFYEQFSDKLDCFAEAYEIAQERLLGVLTFHCYTQTGLANRVGAALAAGLDLLGTNPSLAHLVVVEAPAAGEEIARRHQEWLDRYCRLLQLAAVDNPDVATTKAALEPAIVGAIVSRVKQLILAGEVEELPRLCPELVQLTLAYYSSPALPRTSVAGGGVDSSQPQSPARRTVLEPA